MKLKVKRLLRNLQEVWMLSLLVLSFIFIFAGDTKRAIAIAVIYFVIKVVEKLEIIGENLVFIWGQINARNKHDGIE
ncbi:hypothetical protein [Enterococcus hailinensis]|uniref:hypothetical protein n=1 Tax=Enterococcus hailinensis TaxID=3238988 RepID=UPI0038B25696